MRKNASGFTIIELIVVIAVIGILATISIIGFSRFQADGRNAQRVARVNIIAEALEKYYDKNGEYPSCPVMQGSVSNLTQTVLPGLEPGIFLAPLSALNVTNSVSCTDLTGANGEPDSFAYVGETSTDCLSGQACLQFILKYREEGTGNIISTLSRRQFYFIAADAPVLNAAASGYSQVNLTWSAVAKAGSYNVQYATDIGFTNSLITQSVSGTSVSIPGLATGVTYYFRVRAVNGAVFSDWSNVRSIVVNFTNIAWAENTTVPLSYWRSAASSADGNKLLAGIQFNGGYLYTSTDAGTTWVTRTSSGDLGWGSAASSSDGVKLAAASGSIIKTSTDSGATWVTSFTVSTRQWWGLASSADGTKLAASTIKNSTSGGSVYTSADSGATWTERPSAGLGDWRSVSSSADGTKLAAVSADGLVSTSVDSGVTWVPRTIPGSLTFWCVRSSTDGTKLIASATINNYVYMSADSGATWVAKTGAGSRNWRDVTISADGTKLAAASWGGYIYTSLDAGATWTAQISAGSRFWLILTSSADGSKLFSGASSGGYLYNGVYGP